MLGLSLGAVLKPPFAVLFEAPLVWRLSAVPFDLGKSFESFFLALYLKDMPLLVFIIVINDPFTASASYRSHLPFLLSFDFSEILLDEISDYHTRRSLLTARLLQQLFPERVGYGEAFDCHPPSCRRSLGCHFFLLSFYGGIETYIRII